jgi:hypothetical protein
MILMLERVEKHPGATPAAFPPPIFTRIAFVSMFHVSLPPLIRIIEGGLYIGIFRSSCASGDEDGRNRRLKAQTGMGGTA